jgi:hypothetical protein
VTENQKLILNGNMLHFDVNLPLPDADMYDTRKKRLQSKYAKQLLMTDVDTINEMLNKEYNEKLVSEGIAFTRKELKSKNQIDIRGLNGNTSGSKQTIPSFNAYPERAALIDSAGWLSCIPCMNEAVIRVNDMRYIYYYVTDVDIVKTSYRVFLQDYIFSNGAYMVGAYGTTGIRFDNNAYAVIEPDRQEKQDIVLMPKLYRMFSAKEMHWDSMKADIWNEMTVKYADDITDRMFRKNNTNQFYELVKAFITIITVTNTELYLNKPKRPQKKTKSAAKISIENADNESQPEKVVRRIGGMSVTSVKIPKLPTEKSVIRYKVLQWQTRGHIRTLKSGKQVYVKPYTNTRHALEEKNIQSVEAQQIMKFEKRKPREK